jgi:hypothetical protein
MLPGSTRPTSTTSQPTVGYWYLVPPWLLDGLPWLQLLHTGICSWVGEDAAVVLLRCSAVVLPGSWLLERFPCMPVRFRSTGTAMLLYSPVAQPARPALSGLSTQLLHM